MSLQVFGNHYSSCTDRVLTALNFHGVSDYTFNTLDFATEDHKKPEYLKVQPFGQLPAIKHGDFVLFESRPIVRYIDSVFSHQSHKNLVPADARQRALAEQWLSVDHDNIQPVLKAVVSEKQKWYSPTVDEQRVKLNFEKAEGVFDILEHHLAKQKTEYFVGNEFSIVEVSLLPYLQLFYSLGGEYAAQVDSRAHLSAWWKRTSAHPAWLATLKRGK